MAQKRLKTLNLCDHSVEWLAKKQNASQFAREAILMHDYLKQEQLDLTTAMRRNYRDLKIAAAIIREMMPYFEQGDHPTAIGLGVDLIKAELIAGEMKEAA